MNRSTRWQNRAITFTGILLGILMTAAVGPFIGFTLMGLPGLLPGLPPGLLIGTILGIGIVQTFDLWAKRNSAKVENSYPY